MTIKTIGYRDGSKGWSVLCTNRHENKSCDQESCVLTEDFFDGLYQRVVRIDENLQWQLQEHHKELIQCQKTLAVKEKELIKHQHAIERLYEMREEDSIDKITFLERKSSREEQIQTLRHEIGGLKLIIRERSSMPYWTI